MTWFKVCDGFHAHRKVEALQAMPVGTYTAAITVWTLMGSDCGARVSDGYFSRVRARKVTALPPKTLDAAIAALVSVGLFDLVDESEVSFRSWAEYQPTKASLAAERAAKAAAGKAGGLKSGEVRGKHLLQNREAPASESGSTTPPPDEARARVSPSRPVPSQPEGENPPARAPTRGEPPTDAPPPPAPPSATPRGDGRGIQGSATAIPETPAPLPEATPDGATPATVATETRPPTPSSPPNPAPGTVDVHEVLRALRAAKVYLTLTNTQVVTLGRVIADLAEPWTHAGLRRFVEHCKGQHTRANAEGERWKPTQESLMGTGEKWTKLLSLYGEAQSCDRCAAKPGTARAVADAPPVAKAPATPMPNGFRILADAFAATDAARRGAHG